MPQEVSTTPASSKKKVKLETWDNVLKVGSDICFAHLAKMLNSKCRRPHLPCKISGH